MTRPASATEENGRIDAVLKSLSELCGPLIQ